MTSTLRSLTQSFVLSVEMRLQLSPVVRLQNRRGECCQRTVIMLTQFGVGPAARRAECIESSANTSVRGLFDKVKPVPVGRKRALIKGSVPRLLQRRNCELFNHS